MPVDLTVAAAPATAVRAHATLTALGYAVATTSSERALPARGRVLQMWAVRGDVRVDLRWFQPEGTRRWVLESGSFLGRGDRDPAVFVTLHGNTISVRDNRVHGSLGGFARVKSVADALKVAAWPNDAIGSWLPGAMGSRACRWW